MSFEPENLLPNLEKFTNFGKSGLDDPSHGCKNDIIEKSRFKTKEEFENVAVGLQTNDFVIPIVQSR